MGKRLLGSGGLFLAGMLLLSLGSTGAQEKKAGDPPAKNDLNDSLREVINVGAEIFNKQGDHAGCYRVYQGALLAVKPLVGPALQTKIEQGIAGADQLPAFSDRAFALRRLIDEVRTSVKNAPRVDPRLPEEKKIEEKKIFEEKKLPEKKIEEKKILEEKKVPEVKVPEKKIEEKKVPEVKVPEKKIPDLPLPPEKKTPEKKVEEKKIEEKKVEEKKVEEKKIEEKKIEEKKIEEEKKQPEVKAGEKVQVSGRVTFDGKPLPPGYMVTFVSEKNRKFGIALQKDGTYRLSTPIPPGSYRVLIERFNDAEPSPIDVPARYRSETTSGLVTEVRPGVNRDVNFNLAK